MPTLIPATALPRFTVAHQDQPALDASLQRLLVTERSPGRALCELELVDWGAASDGTVTYLWRDGRVLNIGTTLSVRLGTDTLFEGRVLALDGRLLPGALPTLVLRCAGRRPGSGQPGAPLQLRWGAELLRLEARVETPGRSRQRPGAPHRLVTRARGEATSAAPAGPNTLRAAGEVDLTGVGVVFEGRYAVAEVSHRFDRDQGWRVDFAATRSAGQGRGP